MQLSYNSWAPGSRHVPLQVSLPSRRYLQLTGRTATQSQNPSCFPTIQNWVQLTFLPLAMDRIEYTYYLSVRTSTGRDYSVPSTESMVTGAPLVSFWRAATEV